MVKTFFLIPLNLGFNLAVILGETFPISFRTFPEATIAKTCPAILITKAPLSNLIVWPSNLPCSLIAEGSSSRTVLGFFLIAFPKSDNPFKVN